MDMMDNTKGATGISSGGTYSANPMTLAFLEANCGWVPWLLGRMDDHYEIQFGVSPDQLPEEPSVYFKRQCFASTEADEDFVKHFVQYMGDDQIVFSTDWPHPDSKYPNAVGSFLENDISHVTKRKILWDNYQRLYGL